MVSTAALHARVRGSVPGLGGLKETKMFLPHPRVKVSIVGSLRDREVAFSTSDRHGSIFESCVWRTVSSHSSHHPQKVLLAQFSLYVHKGGLKPDSFISRQQVLTQRGLRSGEPCGGGGDAVDIKNGFHHIKIHSLYLSTVQRSCLVTLITKAIDTTSNSYQPLWLRCWRGDISSFLQKN